MTGTADSFFAPRGIEMSNKTPKHHPDGEDAGGRRGATRRDQQLRPDRSPSEVQFDQTVAHLNRSPEGQKFLRDLTAQRGDDGAREFLLGEGRFGLVEAGNFLALRRQANGERLAALCEVSS